ncbi:uncharacterized protein LOC126376738 [Pectinophora gossypiella]|uniref:uncharacterized protein LOC126376738 n=1 Tax=Pectinophora gossypiella TaxID=13191 RepID=UPI00214E090F|nr:uncharacterized protein LOC126376738 [Pectinophora gossypiella]
MGPAMLIVCACAVLVAVQTDAVSGSRCPPPNKVYFSKPVCRDDYDCKKGQVCCPNTSRTMSCTEPAPFSAGNDKYANNNKYAGNNKYRDDKYAGYDKYKSAPHGRSEHCGASVPPA